MAQPPEKSEGAFRTIREVADWLAVPTHVLRFWESKFDMIAPVKGAGGRRYYRPEDMRLLGGIKVLLHDQGLTIRGVIQKIGADGVGPVMALSPDLDASDPPLQRTRRVIRSDDEAPRVVPFQSRPDQGRVGTAVRREAGEPDDDMDPDDQTPQPDDDPMPAQPVDTPAPPQPDDHGLREPRLPRQPVDDGAARVPGAPAVPVRESDPVRPDSEEGDEDDMADDGIGDTPDDVGSNDELQPVDPPAPEEEGVGQLGERSDEGEPVDDPRPAPSARPDALPVGGLVLAPGQRRRLRRVLHRLRGMIEDLEEDLSRREDH